MNAEEQMRPHRAVFCIERYETVPDTLVKEVASRQQNTLIGGAPIDYLNNPCEIRRMTAGPRMTANKEGKIKNTSGKTILTGV